LNGRFRVSGFPPKRSFTVRNPEDTCQTGKAESWRLGDRRSKTAKSIGEGNQVQKLGVEAICNVRGAAYVVERA
jgi:hypothetical protein